jgi:hypothetical protein
MGNGRNAERRGSPARRRHQSRPSGQISSTSSDIIVTPLTPPSSQALFLSMFSSSPTSMLAANRCRVIRFIFSAASALKTAAAQDVFTPKHSSSCKEEPGQLKHLSVHHRSSPLKTPLKELNYSAAPAPTLTLNPQTTSPDDLHIPSSPPPKHGPHASLKSSPQHPQ